MNVRQKYIMPVLKVLLLLCIIQVSRGLLVCFTWRFIFKASALRDTAEIISFLIIGSALFFILKPSRESLALNFPKTKRAHILYLVSSAAAVLFAAESFVFEGFSYASVTKSVLSVIIIPVFEELLFRGFIWGFLKKYLKSELAVLIAVTVFFALWHLGYVDDILYRTSAAGHKIDIVNIMFFKVMTVAAIGLVIGFVKMKAKNTYAGILVHIVINVFGR